MSYSIYLLHYPLLLVFFKVMMLWSMPDLTRAALMYGVCFPAIIGSSYAFYWCFERPFLRARLRAVTPA